jgi:hypothetical protein
MTRYSFVPARPDYPVASVAYFSSAALTDSYDRSISTMRRATRAI